MATLSERLGSLTVLVGVVEGQTTQSPKEKGQTTQSPKEKRQTTQSPKEKRQTTQSPKDIKLVFVASLLKTQH